MRPMGDGSFSEAVGASGGRTLPKQSRLILEKDITRLNIIDHSEYSN